MRFALCVMMLDDRTDSNTPPNPYTGELNWTPEANRFGWGSLTRSLDQICDAFGAPRCRSLTRPRETTPSRIERALLATWDPCMYSLQSLNRDGANWLA